MPLFSNPLTVCIHNFNLFIAPVKRTPKGTPKVAILIPVLCNPSLSARIERSVQIEYTHMEKTENKNVSDSDYELHENGGRPKKLKLQ